MYSSSLILMVLISLCFQNSATYWEGNCEAESLQRLYGISFPNDKQVMSYYSYAENEYTPLERVEPKMEMTIYGHAESDLFFMN